MIDLEYSEVLAYPASAVFAVLTDPTVRPDWQSSLVDLRAEPEGQITPETRLIENRKYMGYKTEDVLIVSAYEPGKQLILETEPGVPALSRERYLLEPVAEQSCRLVLRSEAAGIPKMFEGLARKAQTKELPLMVERLKFILANRSA